MHGDRFERCSNHRDPSWFEGPEPGENLGDRLVGWCCVLIGAAFMIGAAWALIEALGAAL